MKKIKKKAMYYLGYRSCLIDMGIRAQLLAEYLHQESAKRGELAKDKNGETISSLSIDETAQIIEEYFNKALNGK